MNMTTDQTYMFVLANAVIGMVMPPAIDLLNRLFRVQASTARYWVTVLICIVFAYGITQDRLRFGSVEEFFISMGTIFFMSQTVYKNLYDSSGLQMRVRNTQ